MGDTWPVPHRSSRSSAGVNVCESLLHKVVRGYHDAQAERETPQSFLSFPGRATCGPAHCHGPQVVYKQTHLRESRRGPQRPQRHAPGPVSGAEPSIAVATLVSWPVRVTEGTERGLQ